MRRLLVLSVLYGSLFGCGGMPDEKAVVQRGPNEPDPSEEFEAVVQAKDYVLKFIKYPHNASFGWGNSARHLGKHAWVVTGTITARNAFGADLTHDYSCVVWLDGNTWHCRTVVIGEDVAYLSDEQSPHELSKADANERRKAEAEQAGPFVAHDLDDDEVEAPPPPPVAAMSNEQAEARGQLIGQWRSWVS
jgi:hypothetical protein